MARLSDRINLSDRLRQNPIPSLIEMTKSLIETRRYSQGTIWHYNEKFNDLQRYSTLFDSEKLTEEFIVQYIEDGAKKSPRLTGSSVQRKSTLNLIAATIGTTPVFTNEKEANAIQSRILLESLSGYAKYLGEREKSEGTINSYLQTAAKLLLYLYKSEKYDPSDISEADVRGFIIELGAKWSPRSMRIVPSHLKIYLEFSGASDSAKLASSFRTPRKSRPVRAMSNENVEALWKYIEGDAADLRSKAIMAILLATGMRPVDITGLELDDIDWSNDVICFVQSKTDVSMSIRLFPAMGSAIAMYITEQRPKGTGQKYVFLSKRAPYRRLSPSICNKILKDALEETGAGFTADGLHSPRAVRRSLVSRMISKGVLVQNAAASIGHTDEKSVDLYIELDVKMMRSICLPIPTHMKRWCGQ